MERVRPSFVAGVDLGPSLDNESTGIQIAQRQPDSSSWLVARTRDHWGRGSARHICNTRLVEVVRGCSIIVIDAPLHLESEKPWERLMIDCADLCDSMKPSYTWGILAHAWRAYGFLKDLKEVTDAAAFEVFPASWFWLCDFDACVTWKGDGAAKDRKIQWFRQQTRKLAAAGVCRIDYADKWASPDDADALACVLCAILLAEGGTLQRLDATMPPVLFPPRMLWAPDLPESVKSLPWVDYTGAWRS